MTAGHTDRLTMLDRVPPQAGAPVAGCLLMAGGPVPSELIAGSGRSSLDLSVDGTRTIGEAWIEHLATLHAPDAPALPVRIVYSENTPAPTTPHIPDELDVTIACEENRYRGPAGLVVDTFKDTAAPSDAFLVCEAARWFDGDLAPLLAMHHERSDDITVGVNADASPAGVYVVNARAFGLVPERGFVDLKEQWLSRAIDSGLHVRVCALAAPGALQVRTREQLISASLGPAPALFTRDVQQHAPVATIAPDAQVASDAIVSRSIVMSGASVGAGAVVVQSIVAPGGRVTSGERVVNRIVPAADRGAAS